MNALSEDLRQRIVTIYCHGEASLSEVATRFQVSRSSVKRFVKQWRVFGTLQPKPAPHGKRPRLDDAGQALLSRLLSQQPDRSQEELRAQLGSELNVHVSQPTICRTLQRAGITRKKNETRRRTATS